MIDRWLRLASIAPRLANALDAGAGAQSHASKRALHIAPQRQLPRLAPVSFRQWAAKRGVPAGRERSTAARRVRDGRRPDVILWVDTFNNYFHPETSQAALRGAARPPASTSRFPRSGCAAAGRSTTSACSIARSVYLRSIMDALARRDRRRHADRRARAELRVGVSRRAAQPVSDRCARRCGCAARRSCCREFLESDGLPYEPPRLTRQVLLHGHCHQKALMKMSHEESLLRKMGVDVQSPDAGCCGMAGAVRVRGRTSTPCRRRSASACCCRRCERPRRTR